MDILSILFLIFFIIWFSSFIGLCAEYAVRCIEPTLWPILTTIVPILDTYLWIHLLVKRVKNKKIKPLQPLHDFIDELKSL